MTGNLSLTVDRLSSFIVSSLGGEKEVRSGVIKTGAIQAKILSQTKEEAKNEEAKNEVLN
jgi:hypothetical protein